MIHKWSSATDGTGAEVRVVILDYKKAFDLIDHSLLIKKLSQYGINPRIINWICDFLSKRSQRVKIADDCFSEWKTVPAGVPQGTKLGPWLFLVMINDLQIPSANDIFKYVDDTTIHEIIKKEEESAMQTSINEVSEWSNLNKFQLHPKKCKELRISFAKTPRTYAELNIANNTVEVVQAVKILGVTIQNNLKWNQHINNITKKAAKRLYFLTQLKRANVPPKEMVMFYVTCIQSVLLYACQVFHYGLPEYLSYSLERIQKRALKIIYGYDFPYEQALSLTGLDNLATRRSKLCDKFFKGIISNTQGPLYSLISNSVNSSSIHLRHERPFNIPICNTNRFKNTFINASMNKFNITSF